MIAGHVTTIPTIPIRRAVKIVMAFGMGRRRPMTAAFAMPILRMTIKAVRRIAPAFGPDRPPSTIAAFAMEIIQPASKTATMNGVAPLMPIIAANALEEARA